MHTSRKNLRKLAAVLLAGMVLTGCTRLVDLSSIGETLRLAATPAPGFPAVGADLPQAEAAVGGANDFALRFTQKLLQEQNADGNFLCSPCSAWLPLAALVNAADSERRPALLEALGTAGLSSGDLNRAAAAMLAGLTEAQQNSYRQEEGLETHNPLSIANALFVRQDARINTDFAKVFAQDYGGASMAVDFASEDAASAINDWADEHTDGLIPEIVSPGGLDPQTVAALANAIYFSDRWRWEFDENDTAPGTFYSPDGDVTAPFMLHDGELLYCENSAVQAVELPFVLGGSLVVLLPRNTDARALLSELSSTQLADVLASMETRTGRLLLPRFEIETGVVGLNSVLGELGIPLFDFADPPLNGLVDGQSVFLSQTMQSARIQVDEKGTTAAAVTLIAATGTALAPPTEPFEMNCDRPFAFLLLGDSADGLPQILFTGICAQPETAG
ncbi:MAG: serpin family protein [Clostridia bacterium]|nr:serpin family protein [Clostridia bacterium]